MSKARNEFIALLLSRDEEKRQSAEFVTMDIDALMEGDTLVKVSHSTVNYKDGLALTGLAPVVRHWPMIPGVDFSGEVVETSHPGLSKGDPVILNGWGVGEIHYGAYAQMARIPGEWLIRRPQSISAADAMAVGTAGYTAMLCVMALERQGVTPDRGPIVVTGAAGGVGSVAIAVLSRLGYAVIASTGRMSEADYLKGLGAREVIDRAELSEPARPLGKERWAGGIDAVGSHTLANVISMTMYGGSVAACGLAGGMDLPSSVAPFILRGVSLIGVDSVRAPKPLREEAWQRIADLLERDKLAAMTTVIPLSDVRDAAAKIVDGKVRGRIVVEIG